MAGGEYLGFNNSIFLSERDTADRNFALAYFLRENDCFPPPSPDINIPDILDFYFQVLSKFDLYMVNPFRYSHLEINKTENLFSPYPRLVSDINWYTRLKIAMSCYLQGKLAINCRPTAVRKLTILPAYGRLLML
jgi:hypothetical protein